MHDQTPTTSVDTRRDKTVCELPVIAYIILL